MGKIVFIIFFLMSFNIYGQTWEFAKNFGGPEQDNGQDVAIDKLGNIYITGSFDEIAYFDFDTVFSHGPGDWDIFILKLNPLGEVIWVRTAGGSYWNSDVGYNIVVDDNNNCYVSGIYYNTAQFDTIYVAGSTNGTAFIAKYDYQGFVKWVESISSTEYIRINDLEIGNNNKLYLTGYFKGIASVDSNTISSNVEDFYFAEYDTSGNAALVVQNNSQSNTGGTAIMPDGVGNIILAGNFYDTLFISGDTLPLNSSIFQTFIAKYDSSGNYLWSQKIVGHIYGTKVEDIKVDADDNIYLTGQFSVTVYFNNDSLNGNTSDFYLAKLSKNGQLIWIRGGGGVSSDDCYAIDIDSKSNIYLAGQLTGNAQVGGISLNGVGTEVFVAKCDSAGNFVWANQASTTIISRAFGIGTDLVDNVYLTGFFRETMQLGPLSLTTGLPDIFIAKIDFNTSIDKIVLKEEFELTIFPNPSTGLISLMIAKNNFREMVYSVCFNNIYGQLVKKLIINENNPTIDISSFSSGLYFLVVDINSQKLSVKLIKN